MLPGTQRGPHCVDMSPTPDQEGSSPCGLQKPGRRQVQGVFILSVSTWAFPPSPRFVLENILLNPLRRCQPHVPAVALPGSLVPAPSAVPSSKGHGPLSMLWDK